MNTIIAIKGIGNTGKTETIKNIYHLLKSKYPEAKIENEIYGLDIRAIFTVNGVKIGIESRGDPSSRLFKSIPLFVKSQCNIIICATRSKGKTVRLIKEQDNYEIIWHKKSFVKGEKDQKKSNAEMADIIIKKIVSLINA